MRNMVVGTSVRPGRVAVLVDISEPKWHEACLRIIEYFTRMWGGSGNIIIPTDGREISPLFWSLLDRFDPDYVMVFRRTGRDLELDEPQRFDEILRQYKEQWTRDIGSAPNTEQEGSIRESLRRSPASTFTLVPELERELKERLAPFYFKEYVVERGYLNAGDEPRYPHTDIIKILPEIAHNSRCVMLVDAESQMPPLWWAAQIGRLDERSKASFAETGIEVLEVGTSPEQMRALVAPVMTRGQQRGSTVYWPADLPSSISEILSGLPENFSMIGLGSYRDSSAMLGEWQEPTIVVAGKDIRDFALYYALSRMRDRVIWVPPSVSDQALSRADMEYQSDEKTSFKYAVRSIIRGDNQRESGMVLTSVTLSMEDQKCIEEYLGRKEELDVFCSIEPAESRIPRAPIRHFESNNADRIKSIAVPDDGVIPLFETPMPRGFKTVYPSDHRWLTELRFNEYQLPRHYGMGEFTLSGPLFSTKEIRVSTIGPTYFCPSVMIFGGASAESSLPRPNILVPEPSRVFEAIASRANLSCSISDKGVYAGSACEKFGGLSEFAQFLRSDLGQGFTRAFLNKEKPVAGDHSSGCVIAGRRYHDLASLAKNLGDKESAARTADQLSMLGILYRGFALKCGICRYADWHALRELSDAFVCRRCGHEQIFTTKHWLYPEQPQIYYQLDELTYLGLEHDMTVPVLALDCLRRGKAKSFLFVQELDYRPLDSAGQSMEVDINCVVDGVLTIGEAKSQDFLARTEKDETQIIQRYSDLGKKLCARQLVFATSQEAWRKSTQARIRSLIDSSRFEVKILTRSDLFSR